MSPSTLELINEVEENISEVMEHATIVERAISQSRALYALLASLVKGRPLDIVRSDPDSNGFEAYRLLVRTFSPTSKSRALALLRAIAQYPSFTAGSLLEQILKFEELHVRYRADRGRERVMHELTHVPYKSRRPAWHSR